MVSQLGVTTSSPGGEMIGLAYGSVEDVEMGSPRGRRGSVVEDWRRWVTANRNGSLFLGIAISIMLGLLLLATTWGDTMSEIDNAVNPSTSLGGKTGGYQQRGRE